jgi:hypothetical protein
MPIETSLIITVLSTQHMNKQGRDIFISYRREGGFETANLIAEKLRNAGYSVFFDLEQMGPGDFNEQLFHAIERCKDFILVLPKYGLDRCENEKDWVRLETAYAMKHNKNIIPVTLSGFQWTDKLPDDLHGLDKYQAITASNYEYFDASFDKIKLYLKSKRSFIRQRHKSLYLLGIIPLLLIVAGVFWWHKNRENQYFMTVCMSQTKVMSSGISQIDMNLNTTINAYKEWERFRKKQDNARPQDMDKIVQEFTDWVENTKKNVVVPNSGQYELSDADDIILKKHNIQSEEIRAFYNMVLPLDAEYVLFYLNSLQENAKETSLSDVRDKLAESICRSLEYSAKSTYYFFLGQLATMPPEVYGEFEKWLPKLNNFTGIQYRITFAEAETQGNAFMERSKDAMNGIQPYLDILDNALDDLQIQINDIQEKQEISASIQNIMRLSAEIIESRWKLQELETNIEELIRETIEKCKLSPDDGQYLMWGKIVRIATSMARTSARRQESENMSKRDKEAARLKGYDVSDWFEVKYTLTTDEMLGEITTRLNQYMQYFPETKNYVPAVKLFYTDVKNGKQKLNGMAVMGTKDNIPHPLLNTGDIVLTRKGKPFNNTDAFAKINELQGDDTLTFLRLNTNGQLSLHEALMPQTDVLIGFLGLTEDL